MKKKNAFTLIELLAIIVVLAIIFVITVPTILNIMDKSKKGAAEQSAINYKDAIQKFYSSKLYKNRKMKLNGTYTVENGKLIGIFVEEEETKEIEVSGRKPVNGTMIYENNKFISGCLTINGYKVELDGDTITTTKGDCSIVPDITGGLRERVLTLYANEIANASNYFIVYRDNFESADLILYPSQNYNFQMRITEPSNKNTNIPYFDLNIIGSYTAHKGITMESSATSTNSGTRRYFSGIQTSAPNNVSVEMPKYPENINNYQIYKNNFGKVPTTENYQNVKLDEVLTLPSSYNNTTCRDYMVLTYNSNAQFYCITGDAGFTYNPSSKKLTFNYNNGHMYRYKYNTENWNIVFDADVNWTSLNNYDYKNKDILDIIVLSTFDIKDANNNIVYPKNTTIEKLTTNYTAQ
jgi:type II secretory pathway pseudopilin PulG